VIFGLGFAARAAGHAGLSPIPLYLLAGLVIGAFDTPALSGEFVEFAAELGVILGWRTAALSGVDDQGRARSGTALIARGAMSIVIADLGVGAGIGVDLAPLAAGYVLLLAMSKPILMRYPEIVLRLASWSGHERGR
jgi:Kef-type K+ transport system membrane component KefB